MVLYAAFYILVFSTFAVSSRDIPTKKAIPPLLDPIPIFLEITINGEPANERIVLGLFGHVAPATVNNFRDLSRCTMENVATSCYKGSRIHRIIPSFGLQGGVLQMNYDELSQISRQRAALEKPAQLVKFNRPYMLSTATKGIEPQFFINTVKAQWLDGKHVVFGMVLEGRKLIKTIVEDYGTHVGEPKATIVIVDCGEEPLKPEDSQPHYQ